jgi:transposase
MTSLPADRPRVTVGVDTHADVHVAVAVDELGRRLGHLPVAARSGGYRELLAWARQLGVPERFGVEGTGSYGAGLSRYLRRHGMTVVEVNRPDRSTRHRLGKSDPIDAEAAARAVLAGTATGTPKAGDGRVEMIRLLKVTRDSAVKARTQAINQIKGILVTAPTELRETLAGLPTGALLDRCAALRPGPLTTPTAAAKSALRALARRVHALGEEAAEILSQLDTLTTAAAPQLREVYGIGPDGAAALLTAAGDNPQRIGSEASFAALCGTNPIPASSGKTNRHRLNRGGNRQANAALHRAVITRLGRHAPTKAYMQRRLAEGKTKTEILRCLKRYLAREAYYRLNPTTPPAKDLANAA